MPEMLYGAIFDLDGVIADTGPAHYRAWCQLAQEQNIPISEVFFRSTFGMQNHLVIPLLLGREVDPRQMQQMSERKEALYREMVAGELKTPDGLVDLLDDLTRSGFSLAVGSSAPQANVDLVVDRLDIRTYFSVLVAGEQVKNSKPAPDTFLLAARRLGLDVKRCIVFEDAVQGVQAAHAAGMPVIAITTTRTRSDLQEAQCVVDCLSEINVSDIKAMISVNDV